jgi:phenylpyruvate tautomerase PptA (4-oxalocrotonate tautomerase family)
LAQVKIYGLKTNLNKIKNELSIIIHECIVESLSFPKDKKYHRFISLNKDDMIFPNDKSEQYTIIEIMMMEGRTTETKKELIYSLFQNIKQKLNIENNDLEICIIESSASNWGFRGMTGDEIKLSYKVEV